jgi:hypothetical protein
MNSWQSLWASFALVPFLSFPVGNFSLCSYCIFSNFSLIGGFVCRVALHSNIFLRSLPLLWRNYQSNDFSSAISKLILIPIYFPEIFFQLVSLRFRYSMSYGNSKITSFRRSIFWKPVCLSPPEVQAIADEWPARWDPYVGVFLLLAPACYLREACHFTLFIL